MRTSDKGQAHATFMVFLKINIECTDLPAYSDIGHSDTPVTVTVFTRPNWPFIYKTDVCYSDTPLRVTLFSHIEDVTVSGEVCTTIQIC